MNIDSKAVIKNVLGIIDYNEDQDAYITNLSNLIFQNTCITVLKDVSDENKEKLQSEVQNAQSDQEKIAILKNYTSPEKFSNALKQASEKTLKEFIVSIMPTLTEEQKKKLEDYSLTL